MLPANGTSNVIIVNHSYVKCRKVNRQMLNLNVSEGNIKYLTG